MRNSLQCLLLISLPVFILATSYGAPNIPPEGDPRHCCEQIKCDRERTYKTYASLQGKGQPWDPEFCDFFRNPCELHKFNCYRVAKCQPEYTIPDYCQIKQRCPDNNDPVCVDWSEGWREEVKNFCHYKQKLANIRDVWPLKVQSGACGRKY